VFEHTTANPKGLMICYPWRAVLPVKGQRDKGFTTPHGGPNIPQFAPLITYLKVGKNRQKIVM